MARDLHIPSQAVTPTAPPAELPKLAPGYGPQKNVLFAERQESQVLRAIPLLPLPPSVLPQPSSLGWGREKVAWPWRKTDLGLNPAVTFFHSTNMNESLLCSWHFSVLEYSDKCRSFRKVN